MLLLTPYFRTTKPLVLGIIYLCAFVTNVCLADREMVQSPMGGVDKYHAAVYGDGGFGGQEIRGAVELQRLMPRDALPVVLRLGSTAARKTSVFKRALSAHRDSDDDKKCDSKDCSLTTQTCCGDGCMPIGAECCYSSRSDDDDDNDDDDDDDFYCEQGSRCGIFNYEVKCCRDSTCSSEQKEAGKEVESRRATTARMSTQVFSGFTPTSPIVTIALLASSAITPNESIMPLSSPSSSSASIASSPLITSIILAPTTTTSRAAMTTTATATATATSSAGGAAGSISSSNNRGGGDAAAMAGAVDTGLANRRVRVDSSLLMVEGGIMMLGLVGGFFYPLF